MFYQFGQSAKQHLFCGSLVWLLCLCLCFFLGACAHRKQSKIPTPNRSGHLHLDNTKQLVNTSPAPLPQENPSQFSASEAIQPAPALSNAKSNIQEKTFLSNINLIVNEAPVKEVLFGIAKEAGVNLDVHPALTGKVTMHVTQQTLPQILERMSRQVDMRYSYEQGVCVVGPDHPVIKSYRINYVNMTRDTKGYIGVAAEISSTGQTAVSNANGSSTTTISNGNGSANSSRTAVMTESKHHLWQNVVANIKALLEETDKAIVAERYGAQRSETVHQTSEAGANQREQERQDYQKWMASNVIANPETGVLAVRATEKQHRQIKAFLENVMQIAKQQVLIEATIVEVELNNQFQMGIDWSRINIKPTDNGWVMGQSLGSQSAKFSTTTGQWESNNTKNALGQNNGNIGWLLGYLNPTSRWGSLSASVTLLEQFGKTHVISSPKLMVLNNQTAILKVVDNLVYFTIQSQISQNNGLGGGNVQSVTTVANTVPVGLIMAVTPQINQQQQVNLDVRPTISKVLRYVEDPNPQLGTGSARIKSSIPEIQVREMESVLNINSGSIAVLGGLMQDDQRQQKDSVPGLSSVPIFGNLFTGKNQGSKKTELVVFLRPTVIQSADVEQGDLKAFSPYLELTPE